MSVPDEAIQSVEGRPTIFVRTPEGFSAKPILVGRQSAGRTEILGGLSSNQKIATRNAFVLKADLPGVREADLSVSLEQDVLTLAGQRRGDAPEGYAAYRQERAPFRFSRSFALPTKVDPEKTSAVLEHGVLTVTLEKAAEVKPRQIAVRVG